MPRASVQLLQSRIRVPWASSISSIWRRL